jgi:PTS system fructose-specific IIC component
MKLSKYLNISPEEKFKLLDKLIDFLIDSNKLKNKDEIKKAIIKREKLETTAIGGGIAIPHAKIKGLKETYIACTIIKDGTDFNSLDKKPVDLFFIMVSCISDPDAHIKALSKLANILNNQALCKKIRDSSSPSDVLKILKENERD